MLTVCILVGAGLAWICLLWLAFKVAMHFERQDLGKTAVPRYDVTEEATLVLMNYQASLMLKEEDKEV